jgi:hypothetical protein
MLYSTRENFYSNMQGFMVVADGYKASHHFSWSSFIKQLLLTSESIYQTQFTSTTEPLKAIHKFKSSIFHKVTHVRVQATLDCGHG